MHILEFFVHNQIITYKPSRPLIAASTKHVYATFALDDEWAGRSVAAIFKNSVNNEPVSVLISSDQIEVPPQVLADGYLDVSLIGLSESGDARLPTAEMSAPIRVYRAGEMVGVEPEEFTPNLLEQILAVLGPVSELDTKNKQNLVAAINEVLYVANNGGGQMPGVVFPEISIGDVSTGDAASVTITETETGFALNFVIPRGEKGPEGKTPVKGEDYWTDEDKAEIKKYVDDAILGGAW